MPSVRPSRLGIGFKPLTAMNLFQYRGVAVLLMVVVVIVLSAEHMSAALRNRLARSSIQILLDRLG